MLFAPQPDVLAVGSQMHIPDGFLNGLVSIVFWLLTIAGVGVALWRAGKELDERQVPLMGVLGATIFAGQMLNFTVAGGTSGHLMGAAIATILLGPWPAVLVMTSVVSIQALLFQDGGLLVMGANIFNMAIVGVFVAYGIYQTALKLAPRKRWSTFAGGFAAAWGSIVIASLVTALQLAFSGTSPANVTVPAMGLIHMLIGLGEGLITVGALAFLYATRRDLLGLAPRGQSRGNSRGGSSRTVWIGGLLMAIALAALSPLASARPDGLEWVAEEQGFLSTAQEAPYVLIPDYVLPGLSNEAIATIGAGILGALIVFGTALGIAYLRYRQRSGTAQEA
jgi:cobalt/nickel transport system permease protein